MKTTEIKDEVVFIEDPENRGTRRKVSATAGVVVMVLLLAVLFTTMTYVGLSNIDPFRAYSVGVDAVACIVSLVVFVCCAIDKGFYSDETDEPLFFICLWPIQFFVSLSDGLICLAEGDFILRPMVYVSSVIGYFMSPLLVITFWYYIRTILKLNDKFKKTLTIIINIIALISIINIFANVVLEHLFSISEDAIFVPGPCEISAYYLVVMMIFVILLGVVCSKNKLSQKIMTLLFITIPPLTIFIAIDNNQALTGLSSLIVFLLVYGTFYAKRSEDMAIMDAEIEARKTAVLTAQIKPHFINNCMQVIMHLQEENPEKAREAMEIFATYVRDSMENINNTNLVPFTKEMEFADEYLYLQKLRFNNRFDVEKDIRVEDFMIPAFTVQPLVENAVKYGFAGRKEKGTVFVGTRRTNDGYRIVISDDGNGFDESKISKDRTHVGLYNVKHRVRRLTGGEVFIESHLDQGTRIVIDIPFEKANWREEDDE